MLKNNEMLNQVQHDTNLCNTEKSTGTPLRSNASFYVHGHSAG